MNTNETTGTVITTVETTGNGTAENAATVTTGASTAVEASGTAGGSNATVQAANGDGDGAVTVEADHGTAAKPSNRQLNRAEKRAAKLAAEKAKAAASTAPVVTAPVEAAMPQNSATVTADQSTAVEPSGDQPGSETAPVPPATVVEVPRDMSAMLRGGSNVPTAAPVILPSEVVTGKVTVAGFDLANWLRRGESIVWAPYHVAYDCFDNTVMPVDDIPAGAITFSDVIPPDFVGPLTKGKLFCVLHLRDTFLAVQAAKITESGSMLEVAAACYLLCGNWLKTGDWASGPIRWLRNAKGESKSNFFLPKNGGRAVKAGCFVTYGNTTTLRIELAHAPTMIGGNAQTPVNAAAAAFAGAHLCMPLVLRTGLGGTPSGTSYVPNHRWHAAGFDVDGNIVDYPYTTTAGGSIEPRANAGIMRASLADYVANELARRVVE